MESYICTYMPIRVMDGLTMQSFGLMRLSFSVAENMCWVFFSDWWSVREVWMCCCSFNFAISLKTCFLLYLLIDAWLESIWYESNFSIVTLTTNGINLYYRFCSFRTFWNPKWLSRTESPFQPRLPIHAMLNFFKINRTEQHFTGHVLWSCRFRKVWLKHPYSV